MDTNTELQSDIYIKMNNVDEPYKFQNMISKSLCNIKIDVSKMNM